MIYLPPELWLYISLFLPRETLISMINVNSTFFQLSMDERYRSIEFAPYVPPLPILNRLSDFGIAERVRCLKIASCQFRAFPFDPSLPSDRNTLPIVTPAHIGSSPFLSGRFKRLAQRILGNLVLKAAAVRSPNTSSGSTTRTRKDDNSNADEALTPTKADVAKLISGLKLSNVKEYHIFLDGLSPGQPSLFLHTALLPLFGSTLESLSIDLRLESLEEFLPLLTGVGSLKNLQILLRCRRSGYMGEVERKAAGLIEFINRHHHTLQSLTFSALPGFDFSHIYNSLAYFPNLTTIDVAIPINQTDYRLHFFGLRRFLERHNGILQRLSVKPLITNDRDQIMWIGESLDDVVFGNLHTLRLSLPLVGRIALSNIDFEKIAQFAPTISTLILNDGDLLFHDIQALVKPYTGSRLTSLTLNAHMLHPELIDILASHLPQLKRLYLTVCRISGDAENEHQDSSVGLDHLERFVIEMRRRRYDQWSLYDIDILSWRYFSRSTRNRMICMRTLARCIPSIRSFAGLGHMKLTETYERERGNWICRDVLMEEWNCVPCLPITLFELES